MILLSCLGCLFRRPPERLVITAVENASGVRVCFPALRYADGGLAVDGWSLVHTLDELTDELSRTHTSIAVYALWKRL